MTKQRIYTIIQVGNLGDIPSRIYDFSLMGAILLNLFIAIYDTFPHIEYNYALFYPHFHIFLWIIFLFITFLSFSLKSYQCISKKG